MTNISTWQPQEGPHEAGLVGAPQGADFVGHPPMGSDLVTLARNLDMAALIKAAREKGGEVLDIDSVGDGFSLINSREKDTLVAVPFLILDWRFVSDTHSGREYVTVRLKDAQGRCLRLNDGSHGIYRQLRDLTDRGLHGPVLVKRGLRRSEYDAWDLAGNPIKGVTYYLATS